MPVCTPLGQGLSAQLLVEEGNGKPLHHHPSSHFPSLDDTGVSPLSVIKDLPYGRALIIINMTTQKRVFSTVCTEKSIQKRVAIVKFVRDRSIIKNNSKIYIILY